MLAQSRQGRIDPAGLGAELDGDADVFEARRIDHAHPARRHLRIVKGFAQGLDRRKGNVLAVKPLDPLRLGFFQEPAAQVVGQRSLVGAPATLAQRVEIHAAELCQQVAREFQLLRA